LRQGVDIVSKPRIGRLLETQPTFQTAGGGKGGNRTYSNPTTCWCHLDTKFSGFVGAHDVEVLILSNN